MNTRILSRILTDFPVGRRKLHITSSLSCFYQRDRKADYKTVYDRPPPVQDLSVFGKIRQGYQYFKEEFGILMEELKERFRMDPIFIYRQNEVDVIWRFKGDPKSLEQWVITCDSDHNEGFSKVKLEMSSTGTGVFSGTLSSRLPKDGKIKYAGYCNMTSTPKFKSFKRNAYHDWSNYTHLVLRIRGDGRCYILNIATRGIFDLTWNDVYHYVLYTRGGPYWQYVRVPFSKFVFSSKGRLQDRQIPIIQHEITNFGISLADSVSGHFRLEIDYIGLEYDKLHKEEFAYESYDCKGIRF
ncbi:PREDICTED: complex I intermediate-associated protein 30, mitochondrial [Cyphomyrmex costatus]|uniref:Putative complex I intermediate-associated protein 30, mitochondrial n=1 Tax=Cyphomyrmex costatus TaxID=456900 RepID=A0A195D8F8_9HYME|nr:PREDICTED: complex I intermediate-associated protein 30, mitochondrial [Cyphomyrmex costatus]KYN08724.1 putative complex I intermediate-associated protein 30, mitochondrial [Cyphomyrmex costatus]